MLAAANALRDEESLANVGIVRDSHGIEALARSGSDFNAGRRLPEYLRAVGINPSIHCACIAVEPGHPYMLLPVQFATSLRPRLLQLVDEAELDRLMDAARMEFADPRRWGMTFTLVQVWGRAT